MLRQALVYFKTEGPLYLETYNVPGIFDSNLAKKLESIAPPRPPILPLGKEQTWLAFESLIEGLKSGAELQLLNNWQSFERHFFRLSQAPGTMEPYIRSLHQV